VILKKVNTTTTTTTEADVQQAVQLQDARIQVDTQSEEILKGCVGLQKP